MGGARFTVTWILLFLAALAIVLAGIDVMTLVEFAVLFSILVLPLTYLPLLLLSGDREFMGRYVNGRDHEGARVVLFLDRRRRGNRCASALFPDVGWERMKPDGPIKLISQLLDLPIIDSEGTLRSCR